MGKLVAFIVISMFVSGLVHIGCSVFSGEIDATAVATSVHDGDTFHIDRQFYGSETIRLADINASEEGQPNFTEARDFLKQLVSGQTVYLDIDDKYTFDYSGAGQRLVCLVYVSYNLTHYMNVNKALLDVGLAEKKDYDNEFEPDRWTLYVLKSDVISEFPSYLVLPLLMLTTLLTVTIYKKKTHHFTARSDGQPKK